MGDIHVTAEAGPRDGLQKAKQFMPTEPLYGCVAAAGVSSKDYAPAAGRQ